MVEEFLDTRWLGRFANVLAENGWDTLEKIRDSNDAEREVLLSLFPKPGHRLKMRLLLEDIATYDINRAAAAAAAAAATASSSGSKPPPPTVPPVAAVVDDEPALPPPPPPPPPEDDNDDDAPAVGEPSASTPAPVAAQPSAAAVAAAAASRVSMSVPPTRAAPSLPVPEARSAAESVELPPPPSGYVSKEPSLQRQISPPKRNVIKPPVPPVPKSAPPVPAVPKDAPPPVVKPPPPPVNNDKEEGEGKVEVSVADMSVEEAALHTLATGGGDDSDDYQQSVSSEDGDGPRDKDDDDGGGGDGGAQAEPSNNSSSNNNNDDNDNKGERSSLSANMQEISLPPAPAPPAAKTPVPASAAEGGGGGDDDEANSSLAGALPPVPDNDDSDSNSSDDDGGDDAMEPVVKAWVAPAKKAPPPLPVSAKLRSKVTTFEEKTMSPQNEPPRTLHKSVKIEASDAFRSKLQAMGKNLKLGGPPPTILSKPTRHVAQPSHVSVPSEDFDEHDDHPANVYIPNTEQIQDNQQRSGYLDKRGTGMFNKAYKTRWCILRDCILYWLRAMDDPKPLGMLNMHEHGLVVRYPVGEDATMMELITEKKTYVFKAETEEDMKGWVSALREAQTAADTAATSGAAANIAHGAGGGGGGGGDVANKPATIPEVDPFKSNALDETEAARLMDLLKIGSMFIKYKRKKGQDRMIWCPVGLDRVFWGDQSKKKIKGYLMVDDIQRLSDGCFGAKRVEHAFTVITSERTLELEACSKKEKTDWVRALQHLVDQRKKQQQK